MAEEEVAAVVVVAQLPWDFRWSLEPDLQLTFAFQSPNFYVS